MSQSIIDVQGVFSSIANKYDRLNTILTLNIDRIWRKKAIRICELKKNHKVLDLCCGTGQMINYECKAVGKDTEVTGLDFNEEMINVAYKRLKQSAEGYKYTLIKGDVLELPFEDEVFDCVTIAFGLRNIPDKKKALAEMYRVLKPGGKLVCLELSKPDIPIIEKVYNLYFNNVLPLIGYLFTSDKKAYYYLRDSVNGFMKKCELKYEFDNYGFKNTGYVPLTLGTASIHFGEK